MKISVNDNGLLIPKRLLKGVKEVEIRKERHLIVIEPTALTDDPIAELGKHPIASGTIDGSLNHDEYLYGRP
jgi:hypothetical protein